MHTATALMSHESVLAGAATGVAWLGASLLSFSIASATFGLFVIGIFVGTVVMDLRSKRSFRAVLSGLLCTSIRTALSSVVLLILGLFSI